jgi:hypothetical protein
LRLATHFCLKGSKHLPDLKKRCQKGRAMVMSENEVG